jgi:uncharacterized protein
MRPNRLLILALVVFALVLIVGRIGIGFYTEALWFSQTGFASVFWTRFNTFLASRMIAAIVAGIIVVINLWIVTRHLGPVHVRRRYGNLEISEQIPRRLVTFGVLVAGLLAGWWLSDVKFGRGMSIHALTWLHRVPWGSTDPLFGKDLSFYVFALPFYIQVVDLLLLIALWSLVLSLMGYALVGAIRFVEQRIEVDPNVRMHATILAATLLVLIGIRFWLGRYGILFHGSGFNGATGYTDVHARLPAQRIISILCVLTGLTVMFSAWRRTWGPTVVAGGLLVVAAIGGGMLYPAFIQKVRVDPNEFRFEERYIKWNIDFTRAAVALGGVTRQPYEYNRSNEQPAKVAALVDDIPVWDREPLQTAYNQLQQLFKYYHFANVDYDRYQTADGMQQVAVSVREFQATGVVEKARTWLNLHFDPNYIRGLGAVVTPASVMSTKPPMWLSDINPIKRAADAPAALNVTDPSIFFGEAPETYAIIKPQVGVKAPATAIPLTLTRVVAFAWRFADKNLLFTGGLTGGHLVMRRRISERVRTLAPFIGWDPDPYPVITDGHVVWIIDGYSISDAYPLAHALTIEGMGGAVRYMHNTVKATVDAASGEVRIYRYDANDPILATYASAFPKLFHSVSEMPADIQAHIRYPALMLHEQAQVYGHYHLSTPEAFYRAEDVWTLPTSTQADANALPFEAVYQMMTLPGEAKDEFVLVAPYVAQQRQNMTALMVARNDAPHYGELMLYELPRNQLVPGPAQVHAVVEQDPIISPQLSLWRQAGSDVNIGHVRVVPTGTDFLYILPVYLSAQGSPIPELQRIIVSDGTRTAMAPTMREAVSAVFGAQIPASPSATATTPAPAPGSVPATAPPLATSARALEILDQAERALRAGDYAGFGARMSELRKFLQQGAPR